MAASAYGSLVSLLQVIDGIPKLCSDKGIVAQSQEVQNFREKFQFWLCFLQETHPKMQSLEMENLISQIFLVVVEAELIISKRIVEQLNGSSSDEEDGYAVLLQNIESITEEMKKIRCKVVDETSPVEVIQKFDSSEPSTVLVGFKDQLSWLIHQLTNDEKSLQVIPIVGMAGIGKSTLARFVFDHPNILRRFDRRKWCKVSQKCDVYGILQKLLEEDKSNEEEVRELGERLHKSLYNCRYLIIMDDIWTVDAWESLRLHLPDNLNGSRVIVTTRDSKVADSLDIGDKSCALDLLDDSTSWDLLKKKIFGENGSCPDDLEEMGKDIAKSCKGLPLSLVTIAGLLSKSEMTINYWEYVAANARGLASSADDEHCLKVLSLSYHCLPIHLKPCFLYFKTFGEHSEINVNDLIRRWIAEGLVKPIENVAYEYLKDLIDRNLILLIKRNHIGKIKFCGIHDLVRELCLMESGKECLHSQISACVMCYRYVWRNLFEFHLVCQECMMKYPFYGKLRLLNFYEMIFPTTLRLMELGFRNAYEFPLHYLWNLQFLELYKSSTEHSDVKYLAHIWKMPQLRYIYVPYIPSPEPTNSSTFTILNELQKLSTCMLNLSTELIERIPNLKRLKLRQQDNSKVSDYSLHRLECFDQLQSFSLFGNGNDLLVNEISFPCSLEKLTLKNVKIYWDEMMKIVGSLQNLRVLKLMSIKEQETREWNMEEEGFPDSGIPANSGPDRNSVFGRNKNIEWNMEEGGFPSLKVLMLHDVNLETWSVESGHLHVLERLVIEYQNNLEIPSDIGYIDTLKSISLSYCDEITCESARKLFVEQREEYGNEILQVYIGDRLLQVSDDV